MGRFRGWSNRNSLEDFIKLEKEVSIVSSLTLYCVYICVFHIIQNPEEHLSLYLYYRHQERIKDFFFFSFYLSLLSSIPSSSPSFFRLFQFLLLFLLNIHLVLENNIKLSSDNLWLYFQWFLPLSSSCLYYCILLSPFLPFVIGGKTHPPSLLSTLLHLPATLSCTSKAPITSMVYLCMVSLHRMHVRVHRQCLHGRWRNILGV